MVVASRPSGVRWPSSVPRPNSTAWIRVDPTSGENFVDVVVGHQIRVGQEENDLGLQLQCLAQGRHVIGAPIRRDRRQLGLHPRLVGCRRRHQPLLPLRISQHACLEIIENHGKLSIWRKLVNAGKHFTFGDFQRVSRGHAAGAVDDVGEGMGMVACAERTGCRVRCRGRHRRRTPAGPPAAARTRAGNQALARRLRAWQGPLERLARLGLRTGQDLGQQGSATGSRVAPWGFVPSDGGMKGKLLIPPMSPRTAAALAGELGTSARLSTGSISA